MLLVDGIDQVARYGPVDQEGPVVDPLACPGEDPARRSRRQRKGSRALKVHVEGQLVVNDIALALRAAFDGVGIAYLPEDYVQPHVEAGRLTRVLESWCPPFPGYHLYYPSRRHQSPAFALLVEALRFRS
jgi:DNA-binding transcriptional LysR family regulator